MKPKIYKGYRALRSGDIIRKSDLVSQYGGKYIKQDSDYQIEVGRVFRPTWHSKRIRKKVK